MDGRGSGKSQHVKDLMELIAMANGDLTSDRWVHHCWDATRNRPCCASRAEAVQKMTVATVHALYGSSDPRPAESRWTHLLPSFKRTLVRRLLHRVGIDCFLGTLPAGEGDGDGDTHIGVDQEGSDAYFKHVIRVRTKKVTEYYEDDMN
eukprot:3311752-Pyramimonas_sp.AAC.1